MDRAGSSASGSSDEPEGRLVMTGGEVGVSPSGIPRRVIVTRRRRVPFEVSRTRTGLEAAHADALVRARSPADFGRLP